MKTVMSLAVLALLGEVSAEQIRNHKKIGVQKFAVDDAGFIVLGEATILDKFSDDLVDGDEKDDLAVEASDLQIAASDLTNQAKKAAAKPVKFSETLAGGDRLDDLKPEKFDAEDDVQADFGYGTRHGWLQTAPMKPSRQSLYECELESDCLANGDREDDHEVERENDPEDDVVQDHGFSIQRQNWLQLKNEKGHKKHKQSKKHHHKKAPVSIAKALAQIQENNMKSKHQKYDCKLESDCLANGDKTDDHEVEREDDPHDDVVQDHGFGIQRQKWSLAQKAAQNKNKAKAKYDCVLESDCLANGDKMDDHEVQRENDPEDDIVQDTGFGIQRQGWSLAQQKQKAHSKNKGRYECELESDCLANGDKQDNHEVEREMDPEDDIVQDTGFGLQRQGWSLAQMRARSQMRLHNKLRYDCELESDCLANGDKKDDHEVERENDPEDDIVQDTGFGLQRQGWSLAQLRADSQHKLHNKARYECELESDCLANGDKQDNHEVEFEDDPEDDIVQDTGFGLQRQKWDGLVQLRAEGQAKLHHKIKYDCELESDCLGNGDKQDNHEVEREDDPDDDIVQDTGFARNWVQTGASLGPFEENLLQLSKDFASPGQKNPSKHWSEIQSMAKAKHPYSH